jgi:hypothetical protein
MMLSPTIRYDLISTIRREQIAEATARSRFETPSPRRRRGLRRRPRPLTAAGSSPRGAGTPNTDLRRV